MSDWTNADVTPVGSVVMEHQRGWVRIVLGGLLLLAGVAAAVYGVGMAITTGGNIKGDAVARGEVREEGGGAVAFTVPAGERRDYTVYLLLKGRDADENQADLIVRDTSCVAEMPDGVKTEFRGARQNVAATIGNSASVGQFSSLPGRVVVFCGYSDGTRSSRRIRSERIEYVVTPGTPAQASAPVLVIIGGVTVGLLGGFLLGWGWIGRRRPRME
ncbi:MAG: hypothetical protein JHC95_16975 [Solirubrobacteraceae bacterium]|nr:hypothetical protein [Solirubrobacteraceae bacterium]